MSQKESQRKQEYYTNLNYCKNKVWQLKLNDPGKQAKLSTGESEEWKTQMNWGTAIKNATNALGLESPRRQMEERHRLKYAQSK